MHVGEQLNTSWHSGKLWNNAVDTWRVCLFVISKMKLIAQKTDYFQTISSFFQKPDHLTTKTKTQVSQNCSVRYPSTLFPSLACSLTIPWLSLVSHCKCAWPYGMCVYGALIVKFLFFFATLIMNGREPETRIIFNYIHFEPFSILSHVLNDALITFNNHWMHNEQ